MLSLLGCDLPETLLGADESNEAGHWESTPICRLNDRILESAGSSWHDWLEVNPGWLQSPRAEEFRQEALALLHEEFGSSRLFVLKDPRICRLMPFWLEVLEEAGARPLVVSPVRNPLEVAASLGERNGFQAALGHLLWLRHVLEGEFASRGTPRFFTSYDRLIGGWARVATDAQAALGITWPRMSDKVTGEIDGFISENYRHHQQPSEAVLENPTLSDWLRCTFEILGRWSAAGEDPQDFATLDRIRAELNIAAPAFWRLVGAEQEKSLRLEKELHAALERFGEAEQQISRLKNELETRAQAAEVAETSLKEVRHRLAETESALSQRRHEAEETAGELTATREDLQRTAAARAEAEKVSAELKKHIALLMSDVEEKQGEVRRERMEAERFRQVAAGEVSRAAGLLNGEGSRFSWKPFRLRRQIAFVRRSGVFDAEWYLRENADVAEAGVDPLRHFVEFGAKEGRAPNPKLAKSR